MSLIKSPILKQPNLPHLPGDEKIITVYNSNFSPGITGYVFAIFGRFSNGFLSTFFGSDTPISLATLTRGYTAPSISISEQQYQSYESYVVPGKLNISKDLSIRFLDDSEGSLMSFFKLWFSLIRPMDERTYELHKQMTQKVSGATYKLLYYGSVIIFSTDPTLSKVTDAVGFLDIWPTNYPLDVLNVDITENHSVQFTQNFKVNRFIPRSDDLINICEEQYLPYYLSIDNLL